MTAAEYLQLGIEAVGLAGAAFGLVNRIAVANHRDRLAIFTMGAANAAGRLKLELDSLPDGVASLATGAKIALAATTLLKTYEGTATKLGADQVKAEAIIRGQLGLAS